MPRGRQRQCFPGRLSSLAESRQSEPCHWHKNSESEETEEPPAQGGCSAQKPSHCKGELESVEWQVTSVEERLSRDEDFPSAPDPRPRFFKVSEFRFQPVRGS